MHLSDLHVGCRGQTAWWSSHEVFAKALVEWLERLGPPDLVLFTGDLTNRALPVEFGLLDSFWTWLQKRIQSVHPDARPLLLPVPGNHDLVRPQGAAVRRHAWTSDVLAVPGAYDELVKDGAPEELVALFAPWRQWFDRVVAPPLRAAGSLHQSTLPGDWSVRLELPERPPLVVVGLNSAWAHYKDVGEGQIALPPVQFQRALPDGVDGSPLAIFADEPPALLLQHHPPDWLSAGNRNDFDRQIYHPPERFAACLFGHMHEARSRREARDGGGDRAYFQSPSLFGADTYGASSDRPRSGFTFGEIDESGAVRVWPLRLVSQGGGERFDWDTEFERRGSDKRGEHVMLRPGRQPRQPSKQSRRKNKPSAKAKPRDAAATAKAHEALATYQAWSLQRHARLELIGLDAGDYPLSLDSIYVPLRASGRGPRAPQHGRVLHYEDLAERMADEDVDLLDLFAKSTAAAPHVVLLGEPGSGKSTALRKVLQVAWQAPGTMRGLGEAPTPVFLPLRACNRRTESGAFAIQPVLDRGEPHELFEFLMRDPIVADAKLDDPGLTARIRLLWNQPQVLWLLDGLDEVAEELRAKVAGFLRSDLTKARHVRVVVSSRLASYTPEVDLGERFAAFTVRALGEEQVYAFVRQWFPAVRDLVRNLDAASATAAADRLIATLKREQYSSQQLMSLVSSPLMLTLLCIIVLRGGDMPRQRVQFYDRGLRVLLETWRKAKELTAAPLTADAAIEVLKPVAHQLHARGEQDLSRLAMADALDARLVARQAALDGFAMLDWLHEACGVLSSPGPDEFRFAHLGFQEYLTALHLAESPPEEQSGLIEHLVLRATEKWWQEVALLFVSVPRCATFAAFVPALLQTKDAIAEASAPVGAKEGPYLTLARACLDTAEQPDIRPLVVMLANESSDNRRAFLLRVLHGRKDPELLVEARKLCDSKHHDVRARAVQMLEHAQRGAGELAVVVVYAAAALRTAEDLVARLQGRAVGARMFSIENVADLEQGLPSLLASVRWLVAVPADGGVDAWNDERVGRAVEMLRRRLPAASAVVGRATGVLSLLEAHASIDAVVRWIKASASHAAVPSRGAQVVVPRFVSLAEQRFGIRLLRVPAGEFLMGLETDADARPVHRVRLSEFWLAETSVTNAQYRAFVQATEHREPPRWRDRKYSADDQPVVEVSWEDATAYCQWLSKQVGRVVTLPTEAQREYAARGTDGRRFPWGKEEPDSSRASFGKNWGNDAPSPVGSFPAGRGPWGHADLAGNIWEWCADVWNGEAYRSRDPKGTTVDPVVMQGDMSRRCLRGGGFDLSADGLRVGIRLWGRAGVRYHVFGFRVAVSPASTD